MSVPSGRTLRGGESEGMDEDNREELGRRKRKMGSAAEEFSGEESLKARDENWMKPDKKEQIPKSYRESLIQNVKERKCWWEWPKNDDEEETEGYGPGTDFANVFDAADGISVDFTNPLCPKFSFEEKETERLLKPFRRTLVVKLMGRQPSYGFMVKKLKQIWERKGNIDIFDMENDYYLINFQHLDDYMEALTGGPWVIMDAYLSVSRWKPEFSPKNERIESVVAWVRFPDLPAPLFDKKFLLNLGNSIGKAIRLDVHTAQRARGKFARMCVELDLTKPLVPEFEVNGQVLSVVYESMSLLCNKCGWYGHRRESCEEFQRRKSEEGMEVDVGVQEDKKKSETGNVEVKELWKTVQRTRRQRNSVLSAHVVHSGSRFSVLRDNQGEDEEVLVEGKGQMVEGSDSGLGISKGLREESQFVKRKQGKNSVRVVPNQGKEVPVPVDIGGMSQGPRRAMTGKEGNVLKVINNGDQRRNGVGKSSVIGNRVTNPESNLEVYKGREVDMVDKENLHPGDVRGESELGGINCMEGVEDQGDSVQMSMGEVCATPALTEQ